MGILVDLRIWWHFGLPTKTSLQHEPNKLHKIVGTTILIRTLIFMI